MNDDVLPPYTTGSEPRPPRAGAMRVGLSVAVMAALAGAGFGIGWASRGSSPASARVVTPLAGGVNDQKGASAPPADVTATTLALSSRGAATFGWAGSAVPSGPLIPLAHSTTSDGIDVRVFETTLHIEPIGSSLAPSCFPTGQVIGELSDPDAIGTAQASVYELANQTAVVDNVGVWGLQEGAPAAWAVLSTAPSVTHVVVTFAGGTTAVVTPVNGVVVAASRITNAQAQAGPVGRVLITAGGTTSSIPLDASVGPAYNPACTPAPIDAPPPTTGLPPAGAQPSDPAAAKAGVTTAVGAIFGPATDLPRYLDGNKAAVAAAQQQAGRNNPGATAGDDIQQIVFTSPTSASVQYQIIYDGRPDLTEIAQVVLVGPTWKVTQASACAVYRLGGGQC